MSLKGNAASVATMIGGNRLLDLLPPTQRRGILAHCERVELSPGAVLCEVGEHLDYVYFPVAGTISLFGVLAGHDPLETGSIGPEGMLGAVLILNVDRAAQRGVVQTPCWALRMRADEMPEVLSAYPALFHVLQCYLFVVMLELSQTVGCTHFHDVGRRLARTLLLAQDRERTEPLHLTHQVLADILGVQRGAVTLAASKLQREGIIRYQRGKISILDRERLEASSCQCYGQSIEIYDSILG